MLYTRNINKFIEALYTNKDNGFSYEWAKTIINYLEEISDESNENIEFDPVAIRCDYSEMTKEELIDEYSYSANIDWLDDEEKEDAVLNYIRDNTTLLEIDDNSFIIQNF